MILQIDFDFEPIINLDAILGIMILCVLMVIMMITYSKLRVWLVVTIVFLFSLIIGFNAMSFYAIPFSPYIQIFFVLFQSTFFLITSIQAYKER